MPSGSSSSYRSPCEPRLARCRSWRCCCADSATRSHPTSACSSACCRWTSSCCSTYPCCRTCSRNCPSSCSSGSDLSCCSYSCCGTCRCRSSCPGHLRSVERSQRQQAKLDQWNPRPGCHLFWPACQGLHLILTLRRLLRQSILSQVKDLTHSRPLARPQTALNATLIY